MEPGERQAAALAALDRAIRRARMGYPVAPGVEAERLEMVRVVSSGLEGRRRILERHAPMSGGACDRCWGGIHDGEWPCPDWLDAAAGLPEMEG